MTSRAARIAGLIFVLAAGCRTGLTTAGGPDASSSGQAGRGAGGPGEPSGAGGGGPGQSVIVPADLGPAPADPQALCGTRGHVVEANTVASIASLMTQKWARCSGDLVRGIAHEGLEFAPDRRWYFLERDASGRLQRLRGFDGEGLWAISDLSATSVEPTFLINLVYSGARGDGLFLTFIENAAVMRMAWQSEPALVHEQASYAYAGPSEGPGHTPGEPIDPMSPSACETPGDALWPTKRAEVISHIVQTWRSCGPASIALIPHDGIEFTSNNKWYFLTLDPSGALQRRSGFMGEGTWTLTDDWLDDTGRYRFQINLFLREDWVAAHFWSFTANPRAARVIGIDASGTYVWAAPAGN